MSSRAYSSHEATVHPVGIDTVVAEQPVGGLALEMIHRAAPACAEEMGVAPDQEQARVERIAELLPLREFHDPHEIAIRLIEPQP